MKVKTIFAFLFFLLLCFGVSYVGSRFTFPALDPWYAGLQKPSFNPPNWVFGPVWGILYFLMAVSAWLVWRKVGFFHSSQLFFYVQLTANLLWSIIFFGLHRMDLALLDISILWLFIALTLNAYRKIQSWAALFFIPYLVWVSFAAVLNYSLWRLNY